MSILAQLTLTNASPKKDTSPLGRFRRKLVDAVSLQISIAEAVRDGVELQQTKKLWIKGEGGSKELRETPVQPRRWWWENETGKIYFSMRHGAQLLEVAPGKTAIEVDSIADLPIKLDLLRQAVRAGELDNCFSNLKTSARGTVKKSKPPAVSNRAAAQKA